MSLNKNAIIGMAMGTSVAGGFCDPQGNLTNWLNELAFVPVDFRPSAPVDEWSGDEGCGVQYFSQQGACRLLPAVGIHLPADMKFPEQLVELQKLMAAGDSRAKKVYEALGIEFGYTLAHFAEFYDYSSLLIMGRVTSGPGGQIMIDKATAVLEDEFPDLNIEVIQPSESVSPEAANASSVPERCLRTPSVAGQAARAGDRCGLPSRAKVKWRVHKACVHLRACTISGTFVRTCGMVVARSCRGGLLLPVVESGPPHSRPIGSAGPCNAVVQACNTITATTMRNHCYPLHRNVVVVGGGGTDALTHKLFIDRPSRSRAVLRPILPLEFVALSLCLHSSRSRRGSRLCPAAFRFPPPPKNTVRGCSIGRCRCSSGRDQDSGQLAI